MLKLKYNFISRSYPVIPRTGTNREFVTDTTRRFEFSFNLMRSFEAFGGHSETKGLSTVGQVIQISSHRHSVSLSFLRFNNRSGTYNTRPGADER